MTIWEHLAELRKRLFYSVLAIFIGASLTWSLREEILAFLAKPFCDSWRTNALPGNCALNFSSPAGAFTSYFQVSMIAGLLLAAPFVFYQLWAFVAPGLYAREKKFVIPFVLASTLLFVGGSYFCWRAAFPITFDYFLGLSGQVKSTELNVVPTIMMDDYVGFVTQMLLGFGLVFELPLLIFFLSVAGVVNYLHLIHYGRYFVVGAFIIAAILTPPDVTSQLVMGIPLIVLYGGSIVLAFLFGKPPTEAQRQWFHEQRRGRKAAS
ncbi:MAG: twin-arginine translocase subunit TatC [Deltaproteobacteria bacterium]|nr:twin-arginine translocase subunit TatC [Deltaproteobacteria bacterium]